VSNKTYETEHEHDAGKAGMRARFAKLLGSFHHAKR
jgi:hypothetical protein